MNYKNRIFRVIDANFNRAKEGLRVCEDIMRLIINDEKLTQGLKNYRHRVSAIIKNSGIDYQKLILFRDSEFDIGKRIRNISAKNNVADLFLANSQRTKESLRVLEELFSILNKKTAQRFQSLRFKFYELEKQCIKKI